jgi:hypothetical protein
MTDLLGLYEPTMLIAFPNPNNVATGIVGGIVIISAHGRP